MKSARNVSFRIFFRWPIYLTTQLIKPNYLVILPPTQLHSFVRNLPPLFASEESLYTLAHGTLVPILLTI